MLDVAVDKAFNPAMEKDPAALFREMLGQWEAFTNTVGGEAMKSPGFAQAMHGATGAQLNAQSAMHDFMTRALAAANMPSRTEFEDLSGRIARIEEAIARIEAAVVTPDRAAPVRPKPKRTRAAPSKGPA